MITRSRRIDPANMNQWNPLIRSGYKIIDPPLSPSAMADYFACRRRFFWAHRMGLVPKGLLPSAGTLVGTLVHEGMRLASAGGTWQEVCKSLYQIGDRILDGATAQEIVPPGAAEMISRAVGKSLAMVKPFLEVVGQSGELLDKEKFTVLSKESQIIARVALDKKTTALLAGTLDLVVENSKGEVIIADYKTIDASKSLTARASTILFEAQPRVYRLLAEAKLGRPVNVFKHYVIRRPTIRQRKSRQPETFEEYCERVTRWYQDEVTNKPDSPPILISTTRFDENRFPRWLKMMVTEAWRATRTQGKNGVFGGRFRKHAFWYLPTGAPHDCWRYGVRCPFMDLCQSDAALWTELITTGFRQHFRYARNGND